MRGFASGIIATTAIIGLVYFQMTPSSEATSANSAPITENAVQSYLASQGEIAVDKKMFDKWQESEKQTKSDNSGQKDQSSKKDTSTKGDSTTKAKQSTVNTATVQVTQGMMTSDVAAILESKHVIKNKYDLIHYVVNNKLEPYLQLGTYTLSSDMTIAQIASKLTGH